jgi:hypothetical protein
VEQEAFEEEDGLSSEDNDEEEGAPRGEAGRHTIIRSTTC